MPVVEGGRIEVRAIGPDERVDFRIEMHLIEQRPIAQWAKVMAVEDWLKIDGLHSAVVKRNAESVRCYPFKRDYFDE